MEHQSKRIYKRIKDSSTRFKTLPKKQKYKFSSIFILPILLAVFAAVYLSITFSQKTQYEIPDFPTQSHPNNQDKNDATDNNIVKDQKCQTQKK